MCFVESRELTIKFKPWFRHQGFSLICERVPRVGEQQGYLSWKKIDVCKTTDGPGISANVTKWE